MDRRKGEDCEWVRGKGICFRDEREGCCMGGGREWIEGYLVIWEEIRMEGGG